jgi:tetratricopeptide (TPR) repeat protein
MTVLSYTPSHVDREILERLTTGASRQRLIETLVEAVRSEIGRRAHQHHLVIGPRGSGKTHALTLVAHRLRSDPELGARVLPVSLAEEEVAHHPADLMHKVLERLADLLDGMDGDGVVAARRECRTALAVLRSEGDDERALEIALGALEEAAARLGRLLVAILENFDSLLYSGPGLSRSSAAPGQWALRRQLQSNPGLVLLAAAPTLFGEVCDPRAPFYDFFRIHTLEELPPAEMVDLIRTRIKVELGNDSLESAQRTRLQCLADHFEERVPKLRGVLTLTGGLPRFAHLLFDLLAETDVRRTVDVISRFLDAQTPYFQTRLDPRLVPEAELEVLDFLAASEAPRTTSEIAAGLRAKSPNVVTTYLKRLRARGLVRPIGTSRKDLRYDLTEPLFRVWRRFRIGRTEREQILVLAEFVAALFEKPELEADWTALAAVETGALRRRVIEAALEHYGWEPLIKSYLSEDQDLNCLITAAEKELLTGTLSKADGFYRQAIEKLRTMGRPRELSYRLCRWSQVILLSGRPGEALAISKEAEEHAANLGDDLIGAHAVHSRGKALLSLGEDQAALQAFQDALEFSQKVGSDLGCANAIHGIGEVLLYRGDLQAALQAFQDAFELHQKVGSGLGRANASRSRGEVLLELGDSQGALQLFQDALELYQEIGDNGGAGICHRGLGQIAFSQAKWEPGTYHLRSAYELSRKVVVQFNMGLCRDDLWRGLLQAAGEINLPQWQRLLRNTEPLLQDIGENEDSRAALIRFAIGTLERLGPEVFLETLPILESRLPSSQSTLLQPARLAAEVQTGQRSATLSEETVEMRRAVQEVLTHLETQEQASRPRPSQRGKRTKRRKPASRRTSAS